MPFVGKRRKATSAMIAEVYDAFLAAGMPQEKAPAAARAIADDDARFSKLEADRLVLNWMTGAIIAGAMSLLLKAFA